jgi:hypothetical protein
MLASPPGFNPEALKAGSEYAETLLGWALLVLGGSAAALLQSSYRRPGKLAWRWACALFYVTGWLFLSRSIYYGTRVQQVYMSSLFSSKPNYGILRAALNTDLSHQISGLQWGVASFAAWLLLLLLHWVLAKESADEGK